MKLSRTSAYAVRAVAYIAKQGPDKVQIGHTIAEKLGIPEGFTLRILVHLSRGGVLNSVKGPNGGYTLARDAKKITILDVLQSVEGNVFTNPHGNGDAGDAVSKKLHGVFDRISESVRGQLGKVTVDDLL